MQHIPYIPTVAPDLAEVRAYFPSFEQQVNNHPIVFFDNPGGTQVPQQVIEATTEYYLYANANTHGAFATSQRTDTIIEEARLAVADLLNCDAHEVIFGANMTTLTFSLSRALGRTLVAGDEIIVTTLDHDANIAPWRAVAEERGLVIRQIDIDPKTCTLDMDALHAAMNDRTKLVAVGYASNAVGTINDVATIVHWAHDVGALCWIDAVQYVPHGPVDVRQLDCDFLAFSAYKVFGPHIGVVYGKQALLEGLRPYKVRPASDATPDKFETGTQPHELFAGLLGAIDYLSLLGNTHAAPTPEAASDYSGRRRALKIAMGSILAYERTLSAYLLTALSLVPNLTLYGLTNPTDMTRRVPTVALTMRDQTPRALAEALAEVGICAWDGNYYAVELMERLGLEATGGALRLGLTHYNTPEEIDRCIAVLSQLSRA
ncbi:MAG: cysteine desulfurase-like protein [Ktedonobacterales bacterium]|nr:cysteine desulfurase-like protein [Ktedonobacterales bacterium]